MTNPTIDELMADVKVALHVHANRTAFLFGREAANTVLGFDGYEGDNDAYAGVREEVLQRITITEDIQGLVTHFWKLIYTPDEVLPEVADAAYGDRFRNSLPVSDVDGRIPAALHRDGKLHRLLDHCICVSSFFDYLRYGYGWPPMHFTIREAALLARTSEATVRNAASGPKPALPTDKTGNGVTAKVDDLVKWMSERRGYRLSEIPMPADLVAGAFNVAIAPESRAAWLRTAAHWNAGSIPKIAKALRWPEKDVQTVLGDPLSLRAFGARRVVDFATVLKLDADTLVTAIFSPGPQTS